MRLVKNDIVSIGSPTATSLTLAILLLDSCLVDFSAGAQTAAPKGSLNEDQVIALQEKFIDSGIAGNIPAFSALVADNATFIHGSGLMQTRPSSSIPSPVTK